MNLYTNPRYLNNICITNLSFLDEKMKKKFLIILKITVCFSDFAIILNKFLYPGLEIYN